MEKTKATTKINWIGIMGKNIAFLPELGIPKTAYISSGRIKKISKNTRKYITTDFTCR